MRNGNILDLIDDGMHLLSVLILPMRNGNHSPTNDTLLYNFVLILPMRNGNHCLTPST